MLASIEGNGVSIEGDNVGVNGDDIGIIIDQGDSINVSTDWR